MSDPSIGLLMLGLIVAAIMMGFPTAFTMMGLGMIFGYLAFFDSAHHWLNNQIFDLFVQRTYGVMNNDTLLSIPLFVFMGYIIERAALVDKMFLSVQLAFRRVPASLAVTTLLVSAFWGIASGIVGAVVVLMGVVALRPMLNAGYDIRLASGVITAGGTLGILIPPSVMLIVYAAVAGQSIVKLYAAAMLPGFFLTFLYFVYIIGWALINPKIAPKLPPDRYVVDVPDWIRRLQRGAGRRVMGGLITSLFSPSALRDLKTPEGNPVTYSLLFKNLLASLVPLVLTIALFGAGWWYVIIHNAPVVEAHSLVELSDSKPGQLADDTVLVPLAEISDQPVELGGNSIASTQELSKEATKNAPPTQMVTSFDSQAENADQGKIPDNFYKWFWSLAALSLIMLGIYYWRMDGEQLEILKMLESSVVPLALLTFIVLAVILFGITTASESAAIGALGALFLASHAKYPKRAGWGSLAGGIVGLGLGVMQGGMVMLIASSLGALFMGALVPWLWDLLTERKLLSNIQQSTFLTAKTTAMVCWLFVGSALFSAVFALHGGQQLIEKWVLAMNLTPLEFLLLSQAIIFILGWPLEWTEIIVIFVPIFIPLLAHFNVDPILFGTLVAVNLQAAFLSPPVAMSAFYLKGVAPKHVTLNQIFAGMIPYMLIVIICMVFMYIWPGMTLWLPNFLYGN